MRLRIDELAAETGTSSRNIRAYQARGLLPPPDIRGRTGYYTDEHVHRLELIDQLQAKGFSLAAIKQTLDTWSKGADLSHLIGFQNVLTAPWHDEEPELLSAEELFERFPEGRNDPELLQRALDQELLIPLDDGRIEVPSPQVLQAGQALTDAGVPLERVLDLVVTIRSDLGDLAQQFIDVVAEHVVLPLAEGSPSAEEADEVLDTIRQLRPIALEVVRPFLAQELERSLQKALHEYGFALDDTAHERWSDDEPFGDVRSPDTGRPVDL